VELTGGEAARTGKAKSVGKVAAKGPGSGEVTLNDDGTWTLVEAERAVAAGTWSVDPAKPKRIELELDPAGADLLRAYVSELLEQLALLQGVTLAVDLDAITSAKIRLKARPSFKHDTVRLQGVAVFRFSGASDGSAMSKPSEAATKAVYALKGLSAPLPLGSVLVPDEGHHH